MLKLTKFEVRDYCRLAQHEIIAIKEDVVYHVNVINEAIADGRDYYLDGFIHSYDRQLSGITSVCSMIGIIVRVEYYKEEKSCGQ